MFRQLIFFLVILFFNIEGRAQCRSSQIFFEDLSKITAGNLDSTQQIKLEKWLINWEKCYPVADSTYISALLQLGMVHRFAGDFDEAIKVTKKVIPLYEKSNRSLKKRDLVKANYRIGVYYNASQSTENAIKYLSEAVRIGKNDKESKTYIASAYLYLVYAYYIKGDFQKALSYADLGEEIATEIKDIETLSDILYQKAQALSELEQNKEAKIEVLKAINIMQNLPEACYSLANQHRLLGDINRALHEKKEELAEYLLAYKIAEQCKHKNLSDFINAIGFYYYQNKDYNQALKYYQKALDLNKSAYSKGVLLDRMGLAYAAKKDYLKSFQYFQQGLKELLPTENLPGITTVPKAKSIRITAQKDYLLSIVQDNADTWLAYGQFSKKTDPAKLKIALKNYMLADTMIDFMRWEHTGNVSKLFWRNRTKGMYENAIETCFLLKDPEKAFYFFEKSRAVMLNDQLNELGANQQLSEKDVERERTIRRKISDLQDQLSESEAGSKRYLSFRNALYNVQEEQQIFIKKLEKANPQYYSYKYDNRVPGLKEVREKVIPDRQTLLSYFVGDSAVYGLSINEKKVNLKKIKLADYQKYISEFQKLLSGKEIQNKQFDHYLSVSHKLYELLIKPFEIKSNRVIISPDGNFLPLESLSFSSEKPDFLVNRYAFSYTYSASFLAKMKRSESEISSTNAFLGMAPVQFSKKLNQASLPGSEIALEAINKHFFFSKSLTGHEASRGAFMKELSSHSIIQLLTHASADSSEIEPTLYFADSTLTLSELSSSALSKTQLLVLSACRTGVGKNQKGEGVFSLARGFAGIGIPSTLTTLWSVENKSIYELTELFYDQMEKGIPLDIALQQAQIEWLKTASKNDQLPYSWAGMVLVGNAEPLDMGFSKSMVYLILGGITALVILGILLFRSRNLKSVHRSKRTSLI
ncbi:CHAT domain-containing protein [Dyadobacter frigoris]|uniref:CHAT domain-containing protein n=1 Tax=Dyadobacter frigoris TaxID=2576211 RepID=A0A4U6D4W6_9BACT|nr:CHAT domain-containing protein [Dyadobacter frigoris]TKT91221.1 CHAT domain-containing protein [Dyadobacter frigoris]GLU55157.1 hypothetical protein Dfri01_46180 [Dyadobacter frigoris]